MYRPARISPFFDDQVDTDGHLRFDQNIKLALDRTQSIACVRDSWGSALACRQPRIAAGDS
jgi:hypothetical protein